MVDERIAARSLRMAGVCSGSAASSRRALKATTGSPEGHSESARDVRARPQRAGVRTDCFGCRSHRGALWWDNAASRPWPRNTR